MPVDWWTRSIAIIGASTGALSLALSASREWRERPRVRVLMRTNRFVVGTAESQVVTVTVRNTGKSVTLENLGIAPNHQVNGVGWLTGPVSAHTNPSERGLFLSDGESRSWIYHVTPFLASSAAPGVTLPTTANARAVATLSSGKTRRSKSVALRLDTPHPDGAQQIPPI
jgi:hypothetical protein